MPSTMTSGGFSLSFEGSVTEASSSTTAASASTSLVSASKDSSSPGTDSTVGGFGGPLGGPEGGPLGGPDGPEGGPVGGPLGGPDGGPEGGPLGGPDGGPEGGPLGGPEGVLVSGGVSFDSSTVDWSVSVSSNPFSPIDCSSGVSARGSGGSGSSNTGGVKPSRLSKAPPNISSAAAFSASSRDFSADVFLPATFSPRLGHRARLK